MRSSLVACLLLLLSTSALADETASGGLTLRWPSEGQRNWGSVFRDGFANPLSTHDHTGSGKGLKIGAAALDANAVTGASLRLDNAQWLRSRNAANSADTNLLRLDSSDVLRFNSAGANTRADLGLAIGTNVQAYDADLTTLGAGGSSARSFLGLGTSDSPTFSGVSATNGSFGNLDGTNFTCVACSPTMAGITATNAAFGNLSATNVGAFTGTGDISFSTLKGVVQDGATASSAGTDQAGATALTHVLSYVTVVGIGSGVKLSSSVPVYGSQKIYVDGGASINVYPPSGGKIHAGSTNAPISVAPASMIDCYRLSSTQWACVGA